MTAATAIARPNIALVKYWGKANVEENLPASGSLSITLDSLQTRMSVSFDASLQADELLVNGSPAPAMLSRVSRCLDHVAGPARPPALVESDGNFPIAAGLASSASAFAALVVASNAAAGLEPGTLAMARQAGRASGSAARSLFGGFVELQAAANEIDVETVLPAGEWPLEVIVAVTSRGEKPVGSGEAMQRSADTSPFYRSWIQGQDHDLDDARSAIGGRDFDALAAVSEHNCLKMHSVMWTSRPPIVYWNSATVACMETVRALRDDGVPVFFTIDAGPQIKAVCLPDYAGQVRDALKSVSGVQDALQTTLGAGASLVIQA